MTAILLNFSQRPDLQPLAEIIADVQRVRLGRWMAHRST